MAGSSASGSVTGPSRSNVSGRTAQIRVVTRRLLRSNELISRLRWRQDAYGGLRSDSVSTRELERADPARFWGRSVDPTSRGHAAEEKDQHTSASKPLFPRRHRTVSQ